MSGFLMRRYRPTDRPALDRLQLDTLLVGEPMPCRVQDLERLLALFTDYYVEEEPEHAYVAYDDKGRLAGYMLMATRPERESARRTAGMVGFGRHLARTWASYDPLSRLFYRQRLRDAWEVIRHPEPAVPAIVHWNTMPSARRALAQALHVYMATACLAAGHAYYGGGLTVEERHRRSSWGFMQAEVLAEAPNHTLTTFSGRPIYRLTLRVDAAKLLGKLPDRIKQLCLASEEVRL